jgi:hypothetical protein
MTAGGVSYPKSEKLSPKNTEKLFEKPTTASTSNITSHQTTSQIPQKQVV